MGFGPESDSIFQAGELSGFLERNHRRGVFNDKLISELSWFSPRFEQFDPVFIEGEIYKYQPQQNILLLHCMFLWYPENLGETAILLHSAVDALRIASLDMQKRSKKMSKVRNISYVVAASHAPMIRILQRLVPSFTTVDYLSPESRIAGSIRREASNAGTDIHDITAKSSYPIAVTPFSQFLHSFV